MKFWTFPLVVAGVALAGHSLVRPNGVAEPDETQMRAAFAGALDRRVRSVIAFARETGGEEAVQRIRDAGTDRFAIRLFRKLSCGRDADLSHVCAFSVDLDLVGGAFQRTLSGRFIDAGGGYHFVGEV